MAGTRAGRLVRRDEDVRSTSRGGCCGARGGGLGAVYLPSTLLRECSLRRSHAYRLNILQTARTCEVIVLLSTTIAFIVLCIAIGANILDLPKSHSFANKLLFATVWSQAVWGLGGVVAASVSAATTKANVWSADAETYS